MPAGDRARQILSVYVLSIPFWWVLGLDFIVFQGFAALLVLAYPEALRRLTAGDYLLVALIMVLGTSAYLNGFLLGHEAMRFLAALYNLSFWIAGLILILQVRHLCRVNAGGRLTLLRAAHITFLVLVGTAWGCFALAYIIGDLSLIVPSAFGMLVGNRIPDSAPHIQRHAWLVFTLVDWGMPGLPMPRVRVFGPYPTATAITAAVLGSLSLLYLNARSTSSRTFALIVEGAILVTVAMTLSRSVLGGWVAGALAANLLFGSTRRRIGAVLAVVLVAGGVASGIIDPSIATEYREYSSESRFDSYAHAVDETVSNHPFLGLGIKPREESHIAIGSHSTVVSAFTKGGTAGVSLAILFLFLRPAWRWFRIWLPTTGWSYGQARCDRTELRILFNLQVALWVWLCFEDVDAPATAAALIFIAFAIIEIGTDRPAPNAAVMGYRAASPAPPATSLAVAGTAGRRT